MRNPTDEAVARLEAGLAAMADLDRAAGRRRHHLVCPPLGRHRPGPQR